MKAFGEFVVLKVAEAKTMSDGGIALPEGSQQQDPIGTVVSIGHRVEMEREGHLDKETGDWVIDEYTIQVGDRVIFNGLAASTVQVRGQEYVVLNEDDILVVLEEDE